MNRPHAPFSSTGTGTYRFAFNGKENDNEVHGSPNTNYDFGARMYDPRVARWFSMDPLLTKYPSHSSYGFTANNPIIYVDVNGADWEISTSYDSEGNKTIHVKITASFINSSSESSIDMHALVEAASAQLVSTYQINWMEAVDLKRVNVMDGMDRSPMYINVPTEFRNVYVEVTTDIQVIEDRSELRENDHMVEILDYTDDRMTGKNGFVDKIGGKKIYLASDIIGKIIEGTQNTTVPHEFGHTGGLRHPDADKFLWFEGEQFMEYNDETMDNVMWSNQGDYLSGTKVNQDQVKIIEREYNNGNLNQD